MIILAPLVALVLAAVPALAQDGPVNNATGLAGTWATGSQKVLTGSGFANPANLSFTYPKVTGYSFSFTDDLFFEEARYRFIGNGSEPSCITGVIGWTHGTYQVLSNGSIILNAIADGYQQVQDSCAAVSNFIEDYHQPELYQHWQVFQDPQTLGYKLHLFAFDGTPLPPLFQVSTTPTMLPTTLLRNITNGTTSSDSTSTVTSRDLSKRSAAERSWSRAGLGVSGLVSGVFAIGMASLFL